MFIVYTVYTFDSLKRSNYETPPNTTYRNRTFCGGYCIAYCIIYIINIKNKIMTTQQAIEILKKWNQSQNEIKAKLFADLIKW